ncbi:hypothetical protein E2C01_097387 [Portunus trituberculatus]|uniref:Uncharacterized protein n=1 Tax=Portunus trituberculatus TaxID=210409 RepID=A0A5B7JV20_PORTR|nr:hypothetical protein [Portunus trituberculatus]
MIRTLRDLRGIMRNTSTVDQGYGRAVVRVMALMAVGTSVWLPSGVAKVPQSCDERESAVRKWEGVRLCGYEKRGVQHAMRR